MNYSDKESGETNELPQEVLDEIAAIKLNKKKDLAAFVLEKEGVTLDPNSIFDIQIK